MAQFLTPGEHFEELLTTLPGVTLDLYRSLTHSRAEAAYRNRTFVLYEIVRRNPVVLDTLTVLDFLGDDKDGTSCEVASSATEKRFTVGYVPHQVFDYSVFLHLPLHGKLRWSTQKLSKHGSLAFDIVIRTQSRLHLRERGVVYCETGIDYAREFEGLQA